MFDDLDFYNYERDFSCGNIPKEQKFEGSGLWLDLSYTSSSSAFNDAVAYLMQRHHFSNHQSNVRKCLKCILANIKRLFNSSETVLIYSRGHGFYTKLRKGSAQNPMCITKVIIQVVDVLIENGYLEGKAGRFSQSWKSSCSTLTPTEKLQKLLDKYELLSERIEKSVFDSFSGC